MLTAGGRWLAASYARHVAAAAGPVAEVQVYQVVHRIRAPEEVRRGWLATDLRLYAPRYLGTYLADGRAKVADENAPVRTPQIPMSVFAATILREDVWPALHDVPTDGRRAALDRMPLPAPVVQLLENFPALAAPRRAVARPLAQARPTQGERRRQCRPAPDPVAPLLYLSLFRLEQNRRGRLRSRCKSGWVFC